VGVSGSAPLRYQWQRAGVNIPFATNSSLILPNVQLEDADSYRVAAFNAAGSVTSSNATLTVLLGGYVISQPTNVTLRGSTNLANYGFTTNNARFSVAATGTGPLSFQWRFNGANIPGATGVSLVVSNVTLVNDGLYDVTIADSRGFFRSVPARLTVLVNPAIVIPPVNVRVVAGATFTVGLAVTGNPLPFGFDWRQLSTPRASNTVFGSTDFMAFAAPTNLVTNQVWRVIARNEANPSANGVSVTFLVSTLADSDGDGLADDWESLYGLNPGSASDRNVDTDGDGVTNWEEHQAGTDPTNSGSFLAIDVAVGSDVNVSFNAAPGRTYGVEYADEFGLPGWQRLADVFARTNARLETVIDPVFTTNRYYRVVTPRRP
jgi:hypothetical protein